MATNVDKTAMLLQGLGESKTEAEELGRQLEMVFKRISDHRQSLTDRGVFFHLNQITFECSILQAAWLNFTKVPAPQSQEITPPMMEAEDTIVLKLRQP